MREGETFVMDRSLGSYLQNITLLTSQDEKAGEEDSVKLMTIHAAKGLEFEVVFVAGLEENLFPSGMALYSREDMEEERRLFYVAITRAMRHLVLSYASSRYKFGQVQYGEPSRFFSEIPKEVLSLSEAVNASEEVPISALLKKPLRKLEPGGTMSATKSDAPFAASDTIDLKIGQGVEHQRFGVGMVMAIDGSGDNRMATIVFEGEGSKKIMLKFAKLKILND